MSHFTVIVIGPDIEAQLAPFHEFACTGVVDEYVIDLDITEDIRSSLVAPDTLLETAQSDYDYKVVRSEADVDRNDAHKWGFILLGADGEVAKVVRRTNPNHKWDWWKIGGRWTGFFKLLPGATGDVGEPGLFDRPAPPRTADSALKGAIDFAGMRDQAGMEAGATWDKARALTGGATWESWESVVERLGLYDIKAARAFYWGQPAVKALNTVNEFKLEIDDTLAGSREDFVQAARNRAGVPYAIVQDSKWFAKGKMGWWAISDDAMTQDEWNQRATDLIDSLPADTLLTLVDCHT